MHIFECHTVLTWNLDDNAVFECTSWRNLYYMSPSVLLHRSAPTLPDNLASIEKSQVGHFSNPTSLPSRVPGLTPILMELEETAN